jgi:prepilin peptidase CpaA
VPNVGNPFGHGYAEYRIDTIFPVFMAFAAASDRLTMTISNKVSLVLIAGFVVFGLAIDMSYTQMGWHFAIFIVVLAIGFCLFASVTIGGGDAKLAAATAL